MGRWVGQGSVWDRDMGVCIWSAYTQGTPTYTPCPHPRAGLVPSRKKMIPRVATKKKHDKQAKRRKMQVHLYIPTGAIRLWARHAYCLKWLTQK